ncbi:unnamed protein product [Prunus armeniaca]|uniref:Uncharacterized protein n=1 Tax=Prunus armeniaca TaxID=36596 RepID=A0A6J5WFU7_PRUAR|nr:unnamed protein product [Prunus armeniaca]
MKSSQSNSQAPLYVFGGSYAYIKRFIANMYHITHEAQFQRWRSQFFAAFRTSANVSLAESLSEVADRVEEKCEPPNIISPPLIK